MAGFEYYLEQRRLAEQKPEPLSDLEALTAAVKVYGDKEVDSDVIIQAAKVIKYASEHPELTRG